MQNSEFEQKGRLLGKRREERKKIFLNLNSESYSSNRNTEQKAHQQEIFGRGARRRLLSTAFCASPLDVVALPADI